MGRSFIGCDRGQVLLLPPDLREWLPAGHLARFVIETVEQLDLGSVYASYRQDGRCRPAFDPGMMVCLLLYAYAIGVTSSRQVERRCVEDVAFRVICCNQKPDHATIARFLIRHRSALEGLFFEVLGLCRRAGMVRVGVVAVDSTRLAANASLGRNRTLEGLEAEARRIIGDAVQTDRVEDELYGDRRGDELPEELADPGTRGQRIRELLEQARSERAAAEAERAEQVSEHERHLAQTGKRKQGRPPKRDPTLEQQRLLAKKYNLTDPDSGVVRYRGMLLQGYNIQTVASEDQIILVTAVSGVSPDGGQLEPMVKAAGRTLARVGIEQSLSEVLADSGYWNSDQIRRLKDSGLAVLVPPRSDRRVKHPAADITRMQAELAGPGGQRRYRRRQRIIEPVFARTKHHRGITRLWRRGKAQVQAEVNLIATTHNLLKLYGASQTA